MTGYEPLISFHGSLLTLALLSPRLQPRKLQENHARRKVSSQRRRKKRVSQVKKTRWLVLNFTFPDMDDSSLSPYNGDHEGKDSNATDYDCIICFETWKPGHFKGMFLPCRHDNFCFHCAFSEKINKVICPLCRMPIDTVDSVLI
ncbi:uncharacterized protein LOC113214592 [Frankliniella occidentalis]|uniref:Uncharacterized protein LOC113214592 n=1 Tax=Frankliniella occidentalis TaxID=133901 RepID=A0A6J1TG66_FRAOC|nr:uncharacterized protein LOC113214592 [Frankliniella occidentalis]